jgi:hypothetical protein
MNIDFFFFEYRSVLKNENSICLDIITEGSINEQINKNHENIGKHENLGFHAILQNNTVKFTSKAANRPKHLRISPKRYKKSIFRAIGSN